jgi:hypothetical protein
MTLKSSYFDLLDHLGPTQPVSEMPPGASEQNLVCLRHDIDHSLDVALEAAFWEHDRGMKATYYLLNSTEYWNDPDFDIKVRQLLAFGHEVGVHVNSVANWLGGTCASPAEDLNAALERLRNLGAQATSTAAHGDKLCYQHGVTNFWMFSEEVPYSDAPETISAEGIMVSDPAYQIKLPKEKTLTRADGQTFELGSQKLSDFGLSFLGHRAEWDSYFTDSGGNWTRTLDPMDVSDIRKGRTMVLVHPIHWRAPPRQIYILSPARSGSTWLARVADQASSAMGLHEQTLNHRNVEGKFTPQKRTHSQIDRLYEDRDEQLELLRDRRAWFETQEQDVLECNVYLAPILDTLKQVNPSARFAALLRDPRDILVSLLNRGWYGTAEDDKHPTIATSDWGQLDQVEKAAHYIADARARILNEADIQLADLATLNQTPEALRAFFASLGIAFYPLLAETLRGEKINANTLQDLSGFEALPERDQLRALEIIYADGSGSNIYPYKSSLKPLPNPRAWEKVERIKPVSHARLAYRSSLGKNLSLRRSSSQIETFWIGPDIRKSAHLTVPEDRNGAIMIGPRLSSTLSWFEQPKLKKRVVEALWQARLSRNVPVQDLKVPDAAFDFRHSPELHYRLKMHNLKTEGLWQVMAQTFDAQGAPLLLKRLVQQFVGPDVSLSFDLPASAHSMRLVLYSPKDAHSRHMSFAKASLEVSSSEFEDVPLNPLLAGTRVLVLAQTNWTSDTGGPEAAKTLARAGFGTVIWASLERQGEESFVYSEGVNFTKFVPDADPAKVQSVIQKIKQMRLDMVVDFDGTTSPSFRSACAKANIKLLQASSGRLVEQLVSNVK